MGMASSSSVIWGTGENWYNNSSPYFQIPGWASDAPTGWLRASHRIPNSGGQTIQIQFVMIALGGGTLEGFAFDDVALVRPAFPGTDEDLQLSRASGIGFSALDVSEVAAGDFVQLKLESQDGTFVGENFSLIASFFDFSGGDTVPPFVFPMGTSGCPCDGLYANNTTTSIFGQGNAPGLNRARTASHEWDHLRLQLASGIRRRRRIRSRPGHDAARQQPLLRIHQRDGA